MNVLITALEALPDYSGKGFSQIKKQGWSVMCAYTHTDGLQVQRWNTSEAVEPNFVFEEILETFELAELFGAMSALGIAELACNEELALRIDDKFKERSLQ